MTRRVFLLNVPENVDVAETARRIPGVEVSEFGPYFALEATEEFSIDRRATGARHAVWYSCIAGLEGYRIVQWDKDALVVKKR